MAKCSWGVMKGGRGRRCAEPAEAKIQSVCDIMDGVNLGYLCGFHQIEAQELINSGDLKGCRVVNDCPRRKTAARSRRKGE